MSSGKSNNKVKIVETIDLTIEEDTRNITRLRRTQKLTKGEIHIRLLEDRLNAPSLVKKKKTTSKASN